MNDHYSSNRIRIPLSYNLRRERNMNNIQNSMIEVSQNPSPNLIIQESNQNLLVHHLPLPSIPYINNPINDEPA